MAANNRWLPALLLLLLPHISQAQQLVFIWQFPRDLAPPPDNFILAQTETGKPEQQAKVALSPEGACPGVVENVHDTFCAAEPRCPAPGSIVAYWVYAQRGAEFSTPSNIATCYTKPGEPCVCHDPLAAGPPPPSSAPPSSPAPASSSPTPANPPPASPPAPPTLVESPPPTLVTAAPAPHTVATASPIIPLFQIPPAPQNAGT
jgi:hypothetical protein